MKPPSLDAPSFVHSLVMLDPAIMSADTVAGFVEAVKQHFQSLIPHTEEVVVPGINHLMQMRDPKLVAALIADFLMPHPL
ncbi:MAG: hypothetical protein E4H01_12580 [Lysobacterales bacterium]|nr:MAG: hypothetical protein E4H01_12580 [Xanthomonadales bacterium]